MQPRRVYHQGNSYLTGKENGSPIPCRVGGGCWRERERAGIQTVIKNSGSMLPVPVGEGKVQENLGEARLLFMSGQTLGNFELYSVWFEDEEGQILRTGRGKCLG